MDDARLIERFVNAFARLDDMISVEPIPQELDGGLDDSPCAVPLWKPARIVTDPSALAGLYRFVPGPLPPLYEHLALKPVYEGRVVAEPRRKRRAEDAPGAEVPEKSWAYRFAKRHWFNDFGGYG